VLFATGKRFLTIRASPSILRRSTQIYINALQQIDYLASSNFFDRAFSSLITDM
jgi:hypothetical protein